MGSLLSVTIGITSKRFCHFFHNTNLHSIQLIISFTLLLFADELYSAAEAAYHAVLPKYQAAFEAVLCENQEHLCIHQADLNALAVVGGYDAFTQALLNTVNVDDTRNPILTMRTVEETIGDSRKSPWCAVQTEEDAAFGTDFDLSPSLFSATANMRYSFYIGGGDGVIYAQAVYEEVDPAQRIARVGVESFIRTDDQLKSSLTGLPIVLHHDYLNECFQRIEPLHSGLCSAAHRTLIPQIDTYGETSCQYFYAKSSESKQIVAAHYLTWYDVN